MNKGLYGYPLPPNRPTRVAPPKWANCQAWLSPGTYTTPFVVPQNVYQLYAVVIGAGGSGALSSSNSGSGLSATGAGGGGCIAAILDVVPGQTLPTITVGAGGAPLTAVNANGNPGGTSSLGAIMSATGGSGGVQSTAGTSALAGGAGGVGSGADGCRARVAASGGRGGNRSATSSTNWFGLVTGGGAAGTPYGNGGNGGDITITGGWNGSANLVTGGGGIAGGDGGDISVAGTSWTGNRAATGGGAFRFSAGDISLTTTGNNFLTGGAGTYGRSANIGGNFGGSARTMGGPGFGVVGGRSSTGAESNGSVLNTLYAFEPFSFLVDPSSFVGSGAGTMDGGAPTVPCGVGGFGAGGASGTAGAGTAGILAGAGNVGGGGGGNWTVSTDGFYSNISLGLGGGGGFYSNQGGGGAYQTSTIMGGGGGGMAVETATVNAFRVHGGGGDGAVFIFWTEGY